MGLFGSKGGLGGLVGSVGGAVLQTVTGGAVGTSSNPGWLQGGSPLNGIPGMPGINALGGGLGGQQQGPDYMAQANAAIRAAEIAAGASTQVAQTQLEIAQLQTAAGVKNAQLTSVGAIIAAAMGAHTTSETIKQMLPHEAGAATIKSYELAQKWNTTLNMKQQGYQDVAINYALSGKDGRALFKDPQWNSMKMAEDLKRDTLTNLQMFGVKSDKNPNGIQMSQDDYLELMSFKPADSIMKIDPKVAEQRNQGFEKWEASMRAQGMGMVVDIYKNPQLAGTHLLGMKGKDPLIDPSLAPLLQAITGGGNTSGDPKKPATPTNGSGGGLKTFDMNNQGKPGPGNPLAGGQLGGPKHGPGDPTYDALYAIEHSEDGLRGAGAADTNGDGEVSMDEAWKAAMQGEQTPQRAEIEKLQQMGLIDKYGAINGGVLMSMIPPELTAAPEFNVNRDISPMERNKLLDDYNNFASMKVDPKNITTENLGQGVTRKSLKNADGSIAGTMMEGYMTNAMGESVFVSMQGTRLQNWYDKMSMINGLGPLFPGMKAPVTDSELNGTFEPGFWDAAKKNAPKGVSSAPVSQFRAGLGESKQGNRGAPPAPSIGSSQSEPSGYEGAPLKAGG